MLFNYTQLMFLLCSNPKQAPIVAVSVPDSKELILNYELKLVQKMIDETENFDFNVESKWKDDNFYFVLYPANDRALGICATYLMEKTLKTEETSRFNRIEDDLLAQEYMTNSIIHDILGLK